MHRADEFLAAIKTRDPDQVRALLDQDPELLKARTAAGETPVLLAAYHGAGEIVQLLRARGAELDVFEAATVGDADRVRALVGADASLINAYAPDGFYPLGLAAYFGHREIAEFLLAGGAQVNMAARNALEVMPLHAALANGHSGIAELLVARGADVNARQQRGWTPLHQAAHRGDTAMIRLLLDRGAEVNARHEGGKTPLGLALEHNQAEAAELLRERGGAE